MDQHDDTDPFIELAAWAKATERRVRREGRALRLRRKVALIAPIVIAGLLLVSLVPAIRTRLPGGSPAVAGDTLPTESVAAGVSSVTDPFSGTPAAKYPRGEDGITLPPARAVTGFTGEQVGKALRQVRNALIAARLSPVMLVDHRPESYVALFAPNERARIGKWFKGADFDVVATWISPAVRLDPAQPPRVSGKVTYSSAMVDGLRTLKVTTNFVWVYAFAGTGDNRLAAEHEEIHWEFPSTGNLREGDRGMWISSTKSYSALVDCAAAAKGLLAPTPTGAGVTPDPRNSEDPENYLKADHSLDIKDDCGKK